MRKSMALLTLILLFSGFLAPGVLAAPLSQGETPEQATTQPVLLSPAASPLPTQADTPEPTATPTQPTATSQPSPTIPPSATAQPSATSQPSATQPAATGEATKSPEAPPPQDNVFEVSGIEPRKFNNVAGGTVSIYGSGFLPGTVVRLVGYGLIDSAVMNDGAMRAVILPGMKKKSYTLEILRPDGSSLRIENAIKITDPKAEPSATPNTGRTLVYGRPQVLIDSVQVSAGSISPGSPFTVTLQLVNRGDYTATNIRVSLLSDIAVPSEGSSLRVVDLIAENQTVTLELPLALTQDAPAGFHSLALALEYGDYVGRSFTSEQSVGLNVSDTTAGQALVLLNSYTTDPESLSPGDAFTLKLELSNVGENDAEQLMVTLGGLDGAGLQPFAILDAGNVKYIPVLAAGETIEVERRFILDGSAASGVYNLPVNLAFDSPLQTQVITTTQVLNLLVSRKPQLQVNFYRPVEPGLAGQPLELPIELVNIGRTAVNVSTAEVTGAGLEIETGSAFIGVLDGGTAGTLDAVVIPQSSGPLQIRVEIHYLDDFNQPQTYESELSIEVTEPDVPNGETEEGETQAEEEPGLWQRVLRVIRGLFGLGS